ncbi:hypothetical protein H1C71_033070 [Ictidomys tridecemlineatus]|nr:hypothetical protein H1C71_033070 [Ictidomys tridecemlineatus]
MKGEAPLSVLQSRALTWQTESQASVVVTLPTAACVLLRQFRLLMEMPFCTLGHLVSARANPGLGEGRCWSLWFHPGPRVCSSHWYLYSLLAALHKPLRKWLSGFSKNRLNSQSCF